jgi:hypothetical protein
VAEVGLLPFARRTIELLRDAGARFAVVGGFAVSVRTEPRFTRDIDLAVSVATDREAESLVAALAGAGYQAFQVLEQEKTGRLATVRLRKAGGGAEPLVVDLLFASSGIEPEVVQAATPEQIPGLGVLPVAVCGHLIALKLLSRRDKGRPNDAADLEGLLAVATPEDEAVARAAVRLITERGYNRERDLLALLETALAANH